MSNLASSHRSPRSAPVPRDLRSDALWIAGFILAAEIGALAAASFTHRSLLSELLVPLVVAGIAGAVLRAGALDAPQPASRHRSNSAGGQPAVPGTPRGGPAGRRGAPSGEQPAVRPPTGTRPSGVSDSQPYAWPWPLSADGTPAPAPAVGTPEPVQPGVVTVLQDPGGRGRPPQTADLSRFLGQVVVAQCPHCAAFRITSDRQQQDWQFACDDCGYEWVWRPGTPWPQVHVRPGERRQRHRPA